MAEAMVLNSTHVVLTWSPPGDAIDPVLLNYIVVVRNGSATLAQLATPVNETRAIVSSSLLSTCDTYLIIQPICSTTAGRGDTGIFIEHAWSPHIYVYMYMYLVRVIRCVFHSALVYYRRND